MTEKSELRPGDRNPTTGGVVLVSIPAGEFTRRVRNALAGTPEPVVHYLPDAGPEEMSQSAMLNPNTGEVYRTKSIRTSIARELDINIPISGQRISVTHTEGGLSDENDTDSLSLSREIDRIEQRRNPFR